MSEKNSGGSGTSGSKTNPSIETSHEPRRRLTPVTAADPNSGEGPFLTNVVSGRRRSKFGVRDILKVHGLDPNFYYRYVPYEESIVRLYIEDYGYEFARKNHLVGYDGHGDKDLNNTAGVSSLVTIRAKDGTQVVLLRQRKEYRDEDVALKRKTVALSEAALRRKPGVKYEDGLEGEVKIERKTHM